MIKGSPTETGTAPMEKAMMILLNKYSAVKTPDVLPTTRPPCRPVYSESPMPLMVPALYRTRYLSTEF
jgi:hypothetical protein